MIFGAAIPFLWDYDQYDYYACHVCSITSLGVPYLTWVCSIEVEGFIS